MSAWDAAMWQPWMPARAGRMENGEIHPRVVYQAGDQTAHLISEAVLGKGRIWAVNTSLRPEAGALLSPLLPVFLWETAKDAARLKHPAAFQPPEPNPESDIRLLTNEEKQKLSQTYGIRFIQPEEIEDLAASLYGGTDLRALLLAFCGALALLESWLANRLASL